ncbi:MAG: hypothetical protein XD40_1428 [Archaeoglobus fulgidus]|uniref:UPF0235 protein AFULGI_00023410 n=2 Tax=Archaeoglobus fulgidus TaxID=2234 RepID=A0A075WGF1_ARCFL|nr:DUF167 domain-containing protein [Archaeoglobus fulgidus]AIG99061.1 hypothetical protein AFULGI_00023410 [Archaeoglobus fulgidus DSM 8774]KUJ93370.1 MAG: hypothetical protein XD40_1428 [Archaeoglobus fulgidus]KUK06683.1 MAG: hypothetical protein XD48_1079 [Archaeoglobus fulgidus]
MAKVEDAVREAKDGALISVHVSPGSKEVSFSYDEWRRAVEVRIRSPAKEGKANRELLGIFRQIFGEVELVSGEKSRSKVLKVKGSKEEAVEKLRGLIEGR